MELALLIRRFNNHTGGKEILTWELVKRWAESGVHVHVLANEYDRVKHPNITFHQVSMWGKPLGLHRWTLARAAKSVIRKISPDLVYTNGRAGYGDVIRIGGLPLKSHLRVLEEQRDSRMGRFLFRLRNRLSLSKTIARYMERQSFTETDYDSLIVASNYIKKELVKSHPGVRRDRITVIYNGYDSDQYNLGERETYRGEYRNKLGLEDDASVYVFVGNNFELKGLHDALEFVKSRSDSYLLVVGRGSKPQLGANLENRVRWIGEVDSVTPYYAAADSLILPARSDGFGMVVLEALAMGLYVLVSDQAGASELVDKPWKGDVFSLPMTNRSSPDIEYLKGEEWVEKRADSTREFTWDGVAERYREEFLSAVD